MFRDIVGFLWLAALFHDEEIFIAALRPKVLGCLLP
jgi:hypothetical protein